MDVTEIWTRLTSLLIACVASPANYRWNISPDGEGRMHLIDVNPVQVEVEPLFNPEADTAFLLFTRSNPTVAQRITWTTASIQNSNFNPAHPVRVAIHGWNSGPTSGAILSPRDAYLQLGDFNVIGWAFLLKYNKFKIKSNGLQQKVSTGALEPTQLTTSQLEIELLLLAKCSHVSWTSWSPTASRQWTAWTFVDIRWAVTSQVMPESEWLKEESTPFSDSILPEFFSASIRQPTDLTSTTPFILKVFTQTPATWDSTFLSRTPLSIRTGAAVNLAAVLTCLETALTLAPMLCSASPSLRTGSWLNNATATRRSSTELAPELEEQLWATSPRTSDWEACSSSKQTATRRSRWVKTRDALSPPIKFESNQILIVSSFVREFPWYFVSQPATIGLSIDYFTVTNTSK